jgi:4-amino-4-deoxy-L-arabinose transferase-like glycosyltransferase
LRSRRWLLACLLLLIGTAALRGCFLNRPFHDDEEGTGVIWMQIARNYHRYGVLSSSLAGVLNTGQVPRNEWVLYSNHPPLLPLLIAGVQTLAGSDDEWTGRILPAICSTATIALLYAMLAPYHPRAAFMAAFFYASAPTVLLFGSMPEVASSMLIICMTGMSLCYLRYLMDGRARWLWLAAVCLVCGALTDWAMFVVAAVLLADFTRSAQQPRQRRLALVGWTGAFSLLAVELAWSACTGPRALLQRFITRIVGNHGDAPLPSPLEWFRIVIGHHVLTLDGLPLVLCALAGLSMARRRGWLREATSTPTLRVCALCLLWGALYPALFWEAAYQNPWVNGYLTVGLCLWAGLAADAVLRRAGRIAPAPATSALLLALTAMASWQTLRHYQVSSYWPGYNPYGIGRDSTAAPYWGTDRGDLMRAWGRVIAEVATPQEGVLVPYESAPHPALPYYADRQMRWVSSPDAFAALLEAGPYPLYYIYQQPAGPPPRWCVVPPLCRSTRPMLVNWLDQHFKVRVVDGYLVYDLSTRSSS